MRKRWKPCGARESSLIILSDSGSSQIDSFVNHHCVRRGVHVDAPLVCDAEDEGVSSGRERSTD